MSRTQGNSKLIWAVVVGTTAVATALADGRLESSPPVEPEMKMAASPDGRTADETGEPQPDSEQGGSDPSATVPLDQAVATFNRKALSYLRPWVEQGTLLKTQLPAPLTVQDVVTAIADWQPSAADRKTAYPIYERIREKNVLPPRAELTYRLQWYPHDEHGTPDPQHEHCLWIIQLDVFTSETTGYSLPIRRHSLLRRAALTASPGYEWLIEPRQLTPIPSTPTRPSGMSS